MTTRRRYTRKEKVSAVTAAAASSVLAAAQESGVPESTIRYWLEDPEFAKLRERTREELADEFRVIAHRAVARIAELLPQMDARDVVVAASMAVDKAQLLGGHATERTETRDVTGGLEDHERAALRDAIDRILEPTETP